MRKGTIFLLVAMLVVLLVSAGIFTSLFVLNNRATDNNTSFSALSQEDKKEWVLSSLENDFGLKDCELLTDINIRAEYPDDNNDGLNNKEIQTINDIHNDLNKTNYEDNKTKNYYYTIAECNDTIFSVWITPEGKLVDTFFSYYLENDINFYLQKKLETQNISCYVYDRYIFDNIPKKEWTASEIEDMLRSENISNNIHLFGVDKDADLDKIKTALYGLKGGVYIHYGTYNADNLNFDTYDKFFDLS